MIGCDPGIVHLGNTAKIHFKAGASQPFEAKMIMRIPIDFLSYFFDILHFINVCCVPAFYMRDPLAYSEGGMPDLSLKALEKWCTEEKPSRSAISVLFRGVWAISRCASRIFRALK